MLPPSGDISEHTERRLWGINLHISLSSFFLQIFTVDNVTGKVESTGEEKLVSVLQKQIVENKIKNAYKITHLGTLYLKISRCFYVW